MSDEDTAPPEWAAFAPPSAGSAYASASRTPPHSAEAEQSVLGALLLDAGCYCDVADALSPADFFTHEHPIRYWTDPIGFYEEYPLMGPNFPVLRYRRGPATAWVEGDYYATGRWAQVKFLLLISAYGEGRIHTGSPECYRIGQTPAGPTTWIDIVPGGR